MLSITRKGTVLEFDYSKEPGKKLNKNCLSVEPSAMISVITPFYNVGNYFEQTYNCVINQTFPYFEWIIVDDGSTDESSLEILNKFAVTDARIKVIHKSNGGIASARNEGIRNCNTELILTLDADDLIEPTYFECLYFGLYFNPDKDWCYTNSIGFDAQEYLWNYPFDALKLKTYNFLNYSALIKKSALEKVGLYTEGYRHFYEDWHLWIKLLKNKSYPVKENFYGFWYRRRDSGELSLIHGDEKRMEEAIAPIEREAKDFNPRKVQIKDFSLINSMGTFSSSIKIQENFELADEGKQHILMIFPWMEIGGADAFNLEFIKLLNKQKYAISVVLTKICENPWRQRFSEYVDEIYDLPSFLDTENYVEFILYLMRSRNTKLVFLSQSYMGYSILPWIRYNFPSVGIIDYMHIEEKYWRSGGYARTTGAMDEFIDITCTCNEVTRNILINDYNKPSSKVETVYIGVDDKAFTPDYDKQSLRKELDLPLDKKLILFPCRMSPQKRPLLMLEIAKAVKAKDKNINFVAVGNGPLYSTMYEKINRMGLKDNVFLLGEKSDMGKYYNACDLTLICSIKEGLTLTAYESLACAIPVISSDVGGQKELIDDEVGRLLPVLQNEDEGFNSDTYSEEEVNQYVETIFELLSDNDRLTEMGKIGRKRIENNFSTTYMVRHIESIFDRILLKKEGIDSNENRITPAQYNALLNEFNILYSEYAKLEENSAGTSIFNKILHSRKYALIVKILTKLKIKGLVKKLLKI